MKIIKGIYYFVIIVSPILLAFKFDQSLINDVKAQSCSGSYTSTGLYRCIDDPSNPGQYICPCSNDGTETVSCYWSSSTSRCVSALYIPESCSCSATQCVVYNIYDGEVPCGESTSTTCGGTYPNCSGSCPAGSTCRAKSDPNRCVCAGGGGGVPDPYIAGRIFVD